MSVTSEKRKEDPLTLYVDFLNVDLSADPRPGLRKGQRLKDLLNDFERAATVDLYTGEPLPKPTPANFLKSKKWWDEFKPEPGKTLLTSKPYPSPRNWLEEAKALQKEMIVDLFGIAARREFPEQLLRSDLPWVLLITKLNEMMFRRRWTYLPSKNKKHRITIKAENFKRQYTQKFILYGGLAELLESGDLERLRLCFMCHKYFVARDQRQRFCGGHCKKQYDNYDAKFRVKKWRSRQEIEKAGKKLESPYGSWGQKEIDKAAGKFSEFVKFAILHRHPDYKEVGRIVGEILGGGDIKEGWRRVKEWDSSLKNGISPEQIFKEVPETVKNYFFG